MRGRAADRTDDVVVPNVSGGEGGRRHALDDTAAVPVLDREAVDGHRSQRTVGRGYLDTDAGSAGVHDRAVLVDGTQGHTGGADQDVLVVGAVADIDGKAGVGSVDAALDRAGVLGDIDVAGVNHRQTGTRDVRAVGDQVFQRQQVGHRHFGAQLAVEGNPCQVQH